MRRILRRTRVRLTLVYTALVLVVAGAGATVYWLAFSRAELSSIDSSLLRAQARILADGLTAAGGTVHFTNPADVAGRAAQGVRIDAALVGSGGRLLDRSTPPPVDAVVADVSRAPADGSALIDTLATVDSGQRVLIRRIPLSGDGAGVLVVARSLTVYDDTVERTAVFLGITVGVITLLAAASGYWLSGRALRPVREISSLARGLSEDTLDRRITLDLPDDEIGALAATFNAMLGRLESAFTTLERFTADAAHELRTPLAVMRTEIEVALRRPRSSTEYQATLRQLVSEVDQLSVRADRLLTLARADAGALQPHLQTVEAADVLEEMVDRWQPVAQGQDVQLVTRLPSSGAANVDVDMLRRLVDNLVDNALRHTPRGGEVIVGATVDSEQWTLTVEDSGPGVPAALRTRLFERFSRADSSRGREGGSGGLGLSICAVIARLHGGDIHLDDAHSSRVVARFARTPETRATHVRAPQTDP